MRLVLGFMFATWVLATGAAAQTRPTPNVKDYEFLVKVITEEAAAIASKKIPWAKVSAPFAARFAAASTDAEHVSLVMELIALLQDSHSGILDTKVARQLLPGKFDGLFGAGLLMGFSEGQFVVRALMPGHSLEKQLPTGSILVEIEGEPAWLVMDRERRRVARFQGISSLHSFYASLANRFFPFGERTTLRASFLLPGGSTQTLDLPRWGPGGKAFQAQQAWVPEDVKLGDERVRSGMITVAPGVELGYVKVLGSMDEATRQSFDLALEPLRKVGGILLDCRGMGGGSDTPAWAMAGRFFPEGIANGRNGRIDATGAWQFAGPVVMLQDELEVSSAETFTWAMSETKRVLSVGRSTGGWAIIPKRFSLPSGLAEIRIGVTDRPTPIQGLRTEGTGWPPDCEVPLAPPFTGADETRELGMMALRLLVGGVPLEATRTALKQLSLGEVAKYREFVKGPASKVKGVQAEAWAKKFADGFEQSIALEIAGLGASLPAPDLKSAMSRLHSHKVRAKGFGQAAKVADLERLIHRLAPEAAAQEAYAESADALLAREPAALKSFLAKHGGTRLGKHFAGR